MAERYIISAAPTLFSEGEYAGKLKGVTFTAASRTGTRQWFTKNCGQFEAEFGKIMVRGVARSLAAALLRGEDVELPGEYSEPQFERGFTFEWSPIYLVAPPQEYSY